MSDPKASDADAAKSGSKSANPPKTAVDPQNHEKGIMRDVINKFKSTLIQTWHNTGGLPRGAFIVSGLIGIHGPRAKLVFDLVAFYHPETTQLYIVSLDSRETLPSTAP